MNRTIATLCFAALALPHAACLGEDTNNPGTQGLRPNKPQLPAHQIAIADNTEGGANPHADVTLLPVAVGSWSESLDPPVASDGPQLTLIHEISPAGTESLLILDDQGKERCRLSGSRAASYGIVAASCGLSR
jgi:hypothetical protein